MDIWEIVTSIHEHGILYICPHRQDRADLHLFLAPNIPENRQQAYCELHSFHLFLFNLYHSLGIFSRRQTGDIFLIFPRKQDLTLHANCLLRRQFAWNVKSCFLGKIRKIFQNVVCWKFYPECYALTLSVLKTIPNTFASVQVSTSDLNWRALVSNTVIISVSIHDSTSD